MDRHHQIDRGGFRLAPFPTRCPFQPSHLAYRPGISRRSRIVAWAMVVGLCPNIDSSVGECSLEYACAVVDIGWVEMASLIANSHSDQATSGRALVRVAVRVRYGPDLA